MTGPWDFFAAIFGLSFLILAGIGAYTVWTWVYDLAHRQEEDSEEG